MGKMRKIRLLLGVKGILSIACLTTVALALVVYTASVTMNPTYQFTQGAATATWQMYLNEVNQVRFMPGGTTTPWPVDANLDSYAFKVVTDGNRVCAVAIRISVPVSTKFTKFDIKVKQWDGGAWQDAQLFTAATGSTIKASINGLITTDVGYIYQGLSTTGYYLLEVTYTYDIASVSQFLTETATFEYTPYAQSGF